MLFEDTGCIVSSSFRSPRCVSSSSSLSFDSSFLSRAPPRHWCSWSSAKGNGRAARAPWSLESFAQATALGTGATVSSGPRLFPRSPPPCASSQGRSSGGPLYVVTSPVPPSSASSSTCSRFDLSITQTPRRTRMQGCWGKRRPAGHARPLRMDGRLLLHSQPFLLLLPLRGVSDAFAS